MFVFKVEVVGPRMLCPVFLCALDLHEITSFPANIQFTYSSSVSNPL
jgi:hypothetical protein